MKYKNGKNNKNAPTTCVGASLVSLFKWLNYSPV